MATKLDPLSILVDYVLDIKPYHTKIYEVNLAYSYTEPVNVTIADLMEWNIGIKIDYWTEYCMYSGWDVPIWGGFWKPGGTINEQIIEINGGSQYFSISGNWLDFFASDQLEKGYIPRGVFSVNVANSTFTMPDAIPWGLNAQVTINSSLGVVPSPLVNGGTYYLIPTGLKTFKLGSAPGVPITLTLQGAGSLTVGLANYPVVIWVAGSPLITIRTSNNGIIYDAGTDRTRIYSTLDMGLVVGGYIPVYKQSNWDNPLECLDPTTGEPTAGETTVKVAFSEDIKWDWDQSLFQVTNVDPSTDTFMVNEPIKWPTGSVVTLESTADIMPEPLLDYEKYYIIRPIIAANSLIIGRQYIIQTEGTTDFALICEPVITAGSFTIGQQYTIQSIGDTDFTLIGAESNTLGLVFAATGAGTGTGTATTLVPTIGTVFTATGAGTGTGTVIEADVFKLASTYGNALTSTGIDITSTGAGIITAKFFSNIEITDAVGLGQFPCESPTGWGGDGGIVYEKLTEINTVSNYFGMHGDWRGYFNEIVLAAYPSPAKFHVQDPTSDWTIANAGSVVYVPGSSNFTVTGITTAVKAGSFVSDELYTILAPGTTNFTLIGAPNNLPGTSFAATGAGTGTGTATPGTGIVTAGLFVVGKQYTIVSLGSTDFTLIGAADNSTGTSFIATGVGAGTGTATPGFGARRNSIVVTATLANVNAGSFVTGQQYIIQTAGSTDFTLMGALNNNPGTVFTATGPGTGSGVVANYIASGEFFTIAGADQSAYNNTYRVMVVDANTITYSVPDLLITSPATTSTSLTATRLGTTRVTVIESIGTTFVGHLNPFIMLRATDPFSYPLQLLNYGYAWDYDCGWDFPGGATIFAEATFTETIQITMDAPPGGSYYGTPLIGSWDGTNWDFPTWNEDIQWLIPHYGAS
jgi:hypothetical protein